MRRGAALDEYKIAKMDHWMDDDGAEKKSNRIEITKLFWHTIQARQSVSFHGCAHLGRSPIAERIRYAVEFPVEFCDLQRSLHV